MKDFLISYRGAALLWLAAVNVLTFWIFGLDKSKARRRARRIPERTLFTLAAVGGSAGALAGMRVSFRIGIPLILAAQLLAGAGLLYILR